MPRMMSACVLLLAVASVVSGGDTWPAFRGDGSGITAAKNLPEHWSPSEGIAWKAAIPGYGQSAPVVWKGEVFVTSTDGPFQELCQVHAFRLTDGSKLWTAEIKGTNPAENYFRNSRAAPTCTVDENAVYSFFPSGDVAAMSHDGEVIWTKSLINRYGEVNNERGIASSLAQTADHVYVVMDHDGPSYLVALNKQTGEIEWKADRGQRVPSWSSPIVVRHNGLDIIVVSSSDTVDAYDANTGEELWNLSGLQGNHIPSASAVGNRIYVGSTSMFHQETDADTVAGSNCCIELTVEDGKPGYKVVWGAERANSYYSSPIAHGGYVYYVNKAGVLYCVDEKTGKQRYAKRIGDPCWASAIGSVRADGEARVYFVLKNGTTIILRPGDEYDEVARNELWNEDEMEEASRKAAQARVVNAVPADQATPKAGPELILGKLPESQLHAVFSYGDPTVYGIAAVDGNLLIRTGQQLYCVRE